MFRSVYIHSRTPIVLNKHIQAHYRMYVYNQQEILVVEVMVCVSSYEYAKYILRRCIICIWYWKKPALENAIQMWRNGSIHGTCYTSILLWRNGSIHGTCYTSILLWRNGSIHETCYASILLWLIPMEAYMRHTILVYYWFQFRSI